MRILQARTLEWVAMPSSRGSSRPRDWTEVSCVAGGFFTIWATREALSSSTHLCLRMGWARVLILPWGRWGWRMGKASREIQAIASWEGGSKGQSPCLWYSSEPNYRMQLTKMNTHWLPNFWNCCHCLGIIIDIEAWIIIGCLGIITDIEGKTIVIVDTKPEGWCWQILAM